MVFPILGGNSAVGGYSIDNSLRFNDDDSPDLSFAQSTPTDGTRWTWSGWIKRGNLVDLLHETFASSYNGTNTDRIQFTEDELHVEFKDGASTVLELHTSQLFRDVSAWYHIIVAFDSNLTQADRVKIYVNGTRVTSFSTETQLSTSGYTTKGFNANSKNFVLGAYESASKVNHYDGYMAEVNFIDGQGLSPTDFGEFDEDSGIWKPKEYEGTYGTNGFYLDFKNSGSLGADQSGNGNNFTPTNLASTDQVIDTPINNFATLNPLDNDSDTTFSEGNTKFVTDSTERRPFYSTYGLTTGKWYWEVKGTVNTAVGYLMIGIAGSNNTATEPLGNNLYDYSYRPDSGNIFNNGSSSSYGNTFTDNDIIGIALDLDNNKLYFSKNGTFQNSGDPTSGATGTGAVSITDPSSTDKGCYIPSASDFWTGGGVTGFFNFGNPAFSISSGNSDDNGYGNFEYAPPSGYLALCTQNLATELSPTIDDGGEYFNTVLYTGDGTNNRSVTGVGFQPDFVWVKARSSAYSSALMDAVRGYTKALESNTTNDEAYVGQVFDGFLADGFKANGNFRTNLSGVTYVGWNWKAGGTGVTNTDGSITSTVSANPTAGFSVVTYTGNGTSGSTIGHGLGVTPKMVIIKNRDTASGDIGGWLVSFDSSVTGTKGYMRLDLAGLFFTTFEDYNVDFNSSVIETNATSTYSNTSGDKHIAYCFAEIEGYSKFGSYTGNGSTDGTFIYTGFRPAWIMIKRTDASGHNWILLDNKRDSSNVADTVLIPNSSNAEFTETAWDFVSNGFKLRQTATSYNASGGTFIYMAFAENPFVSSAGVPVTAR